MSDKPKRRWYQFSLRGLLLATALVGLVLGIALPWRAHCRYCLERSAFHNSKLVNYEGEDLQWISGLFGTDEEIKKMLTTKMENKREILKKQDDGHKALAAAYEHAVWRPWERYWIDDSLPPDQRPLRLTVRGQPNWGAYE